MKYTKYQYKKKNNGIKFLTSLVMTTLAAVVIGLLSAWILLKVIPDIDTSRQANNIPQGQEDSNNSGTSEVQDIENFTLIQCGYFTKEENAKQVLNTIDSDFNSFIVQDAEGKYRIIAGITMEADSATLMEKLKEKGIENIKVNLGLNKNDEIENQVIAITEGYLEILNTAGEEEVKEVNTSDFKTWTSELDDIIEGNSIEILSEYKEHINALPETINKSNIVSELEYIYSILSRIEK